MATWNLESKIRHSETINNKQQLNRIMIALVGQTGRDIKIKDIRNAVEIAIKRYGGC